MRPVPIPPALEVEGRTKRIVFGPPDGDPTGNIRAVEGLVGAVDGRMRICLLIQLEDGDLERLADCGAMWLTLHSNHLHPFELHIADNRDYASAGMAACDLCSNPVPMGEVWEADGIRDGEACKVRGHRECLDAASH